MSFDNLCKLLAEKNPKTFTQWLVGHRPDEMTILKPELSIEPLKYDKDKIRRVFREGIMRESVIYQEILQEGEARGEIRGEARGEAKRLRDLQRVVVGLLDEGLPIATIARLTEFSPEQIQRIQSGQTL